MDPPEWLYFTTLQKGSCFKADIQELNVHKWIRASLILIRVRGEVERIPTTSGWEAGTNDNSQLDPTPMHSWESRIHLCVLEGGTETKRQIVNCTEVRSKIWTHNLYTGKQTCESLASRFAYFWIEFRCYWIPFFFSTQEKAVKGRETLSDCAKLTWHHAHKVHESRNILDNEVECFWGIKTRTLFQWLFLMSLHCYVIQNLA